MLETRAISGGYDDRIVFSEVSFALGGGEVAGLLGPNAAGKSTLLRVLSGERAASSGEVRVDGRPVGAWTPAERASRLALVPQSVRDDLDFTAAELVSFARARLGNAWGLPSAADRAVISQALSDADASAVADRPFRELSGGERQRVLFARAIAQEAAVWLLDEPTAHLDLSHQWLVWERVRAHASSGGAVLWVLHDLSIAARLPRVLVLDQGRLVADGAPRDVLTPQLLAKVWRVDADWVDGAPPLLRVRGRA